MSRRPGKLTAGVAMSAVAIVVAGTLTDAGPFAARTNEPRLVPAATGAGSAVAAYAYVQTDVPLGDGRRKRLLSQSSHDLSGDGAPEFLAGRPAVGVLRADYRRE